MLNVIVGNVLLLTTIVLYAWVLPNEQQPLWLSNRRGLAVLLPIVITGIGVFGLMLLVKGALS